jgi:hypothetical protein
MNQTVHSEDELQLTPSGTSGTSRTNDPARTMAEILSTWRNPPQPR